MMTLPSPKATTNIMDAIPRPTPRRQTSPRRRPRVAPVVVSSALLGPGVTAIATEKARKASGRSSVKPGMQPPRYIPSMLEPGTESVRGLERSCEGGDWIRTRRLGEGLELLRAWFGGRAFSRHRHDTYAIGVTEAGVQTFDYRGRVEHSTPGQVV